MMMRLHTASQTCFAAGSRDRNEPGPALESGEDRFSRPRPLACSTTAVLNDGANRATR